MIVAMLLGGAFIAAILFALGLCKSSRLSDEALFKEMEKDFHMRHLEKENRK